MTVIVTSVTEKEHLKTDFETQRRQEGSGLYEEADGTLANLQTVLSGGEWLAHRMAEL